MRGLIWSNAFSRSLKKCIRRKPDLHSDVAEVLRLLVLDPFDSKLETHKLKGKLSGSWACSVGYDFRIVFDFVNEEKGKKDNILLLSIGTHDEVY